MSSSGAQGFFVRSLAIAEFSGDFGPRGAHIGVGVSEGIAGFDVDVIPHSICVVELLPIGVTST